MKTTKRVMIYGASGCGTCASELRTFLGAARDLRRKGFIETANPKIADIFVVAGALNERSARVVRTLRAQMPEGSYLVSAGECACEGCRIADTDTVNSVDSVYAVDAAAEGCPIRRQDIDDMLAELLRKHAVGSEINEDN